MDSNNGLQVVKELGRELETGQRLVTIEVTEPDARHLKAFVIDKHIAAVHEAAHTVVNTAFGIRVKAVDVSLRYGGMTDLGVGDDDQPSFWLASRYHDLVVGDLAGMAIEIVLFTQPTDGSSADIQTATDRLLTMVRNGMLDEAPFLSYKSFTGYDSIPMPTWLSDEISRAVSTRLANARGRSIEMAERYRHEIIEFARILVTERRLTDEKLEEAIRSVGLTPVGLD
jgi:ATP-dependent Zn protease